MKRPQARPAASADDRERSERTVRMADPGAAADREATRALPGHGNATQPLPDVPGGPRLVLGRYRLERRLGAGGFGVVWLAWDERLEREVAVKVIAREGGDERVEREARAAARLNHPGIVALYELASDENDVYLVSELVRGRTLSELMRAEAISDRDVSRIGATLCDALDHAHSQGVVHRDVKPHNIMVVAEPAVGSGFAKLADFGVAHVASGDPLTHTGDVVGTLAYMAPEQAEGAPVTPASDVYSLALVLYEAWTGENPMKARTPAATARLIGTAVPSIADKRRDLPLPLCDAIDDALEVDARLRPSPAELRGELRRAEAELDDEGGLVEPATLARVGLTTTGRRGRLFRRRQVEPEAATRALWAGRRGDVHEADVEPHVARGHEGYDRWTAPPDDGHRGRWRAADDYEHGPADLSHPVETAAAAARAPLPKLIVTRALAGLGAGILTLVILTQLGPTPPVSPLGAAAAAGVAVGLLPRLGWMAAALALVGWLASPEADQAGTALVVAAGAVAVPILLPRAGAYWSLPGVAPLLGTIALGPAYVALAGLVPARPRGRVATAFATDDAAEGRRQPFAGSIRRAGLGAAGFLWLALAEAITTDELLFGVADGTTPRSDWHDSVTGAASDVLQPLLTSGVLVGALVWAAFAALLPLIVRGRYLALDAIAAAAWAAGLIVAQAAIGNMLAGATTTADPRGAIAGPILGALVVVAVTALRRPEEPLTVDAPAPAWDYPANAR